MNDTGMTRRAFGRLAGTAGLAGLAGGAGLSARPATAANKTFTVTGTLGDSSLSAFDEAVKGFMVDRNIPAGQLAVTYQGRLVLARGYTWTGDPTLAVQPTSLFRIASMTKPITAAAVMTLVQANRLGLYKTVTETLRPTPPPGQHADPRLSQVTLRRLLQHLGGWNSNSSVDPLFYDFPIASALGKSLPVIQDDIITWTTGQPLQHDPGSTYAYSNYGYLLAGRMIEWATGQSYPDYVRAKVLAPVGITRMRLARSLASQRAATEVPYSSMNNRPTVLDGSGTIVPEPYGSFNMENHEYNGGWLSSAVDMVRFGTIFDGGTPVLSSSSLATTFAVPETGISTDGSYYGLGWWVRPTSGGTGLNTWHSGSLSGTSSLLVRTSNGMSWAALFDQRDDPSGLHYEDIDGVLGTASGQVTSWPSTDKFPEFFPS